jgi:hypothetical protein
MTEDDETMSSDVPSSADDEYLPVGVHGLMRASEKLLQMSRGLSDDDRRDSMQFKRIMTPAALLQERVRMDTGGVVRGIIRHAAYHRSLKGMHPGALSPLAEKYVVGNGQLVSPIEEINPLDIMGQTRRITAMGPGGVNSKDAVTEGMQRVDSSQFGFVSPLEGPETHLWDTSVLTKAGWVNWPDANADTLFACRVDGRLEFHRAIRLHSYPFCGEMIGVKSQDFDFMVTPKHRMLWRASEDTAATRRGADPLKVDLAEDLYGKCIKFPCDHQPYLGLNAVHDYPDRSVATDDFCEFLAWWLAEGHITGHQTFITKTADYKPKDHQHLKEWLPTMGLGEGWTVGGTPQVKAKLFKITNATLTGYLKQFGKSGTKFIPEWVFDTSVACRQRMLDVFMRTDARINTTHSTYTSTSKMLALDVQRLMIGLGHPTNFREEPDKRAHVKSTNWCACQLKTKARIAKCGAAYDYWVKEHHDAMVYCATVPGGFLYTKRGRGVGFWSGNSESAGIDVRMSHGVKIGSNGRLYQRFRNPKTGDVHWLSPEDLAGKTVALPNPV